MKIVVITGSPRKGGDGRYCGKVTTWPKQLTDPSWWSSPERVAFALSEGQRYASRNCSYFTTCCGELLDELDVRNIVMRPLAESNT